MKEEELRGSNDPKFSHLSDDLHVEVTAFAPPAEAHARIAYALAEIRRFLVPFNFVGKLLGPKGNSLKRLQEETMTKMAILGRGSMRDKQKE
ncbi:hypothetical protein B566_EDAN006468 [Ephemera danica]|nr:hypothetical protein B566_EDAN006468 [Ephemera danica]